MTTETPKIPTKEEIVDHMLAAGWSLDKQGNLRKQGAKRLFRMKFQDESIRIEVQVERGAEPMQNKTNEWVRMGGAFYRNIHLHADGQLQIGTDFFKVQ